MHSYHGGTKNLLSSFWASFFLYTIFALCLFFVFSHNQYWTGEFAFAGCRCLTGYTGDFCEIQYNGCDVKHCYGGKRIITSCVHVICTSISLV